MRLGYIRRMGIGHTSKIAAVTVMFVGTVLLAGWLPVSQAAQSLRVRCESRDGRWHQCPLPQGNGDVTLLRQLSRHACIRNHSWGVDTGGLWVARGCRGEFGREGEVRAMASLPRKRQLRCESRGHGIDHCLIDIAGSVLLTRQLSGRDCDLGESWGYDEKGIWVARGCRAEFEVEAATRPKKQFLRRLFGRGDSSDLPPAVMGRPLRCESREDARAECSTDDAKRVELVHDLSRGACVAGQSWGWDKGVVWVSKGCRAEFLTW